MLNLTRFLIIFNRLFGLLIERRRNCTRCGNELPNTKEYFYGQMVKRKTKPDYYKLSPWCKDCQKENTKKNIDKDREGFYQKQKPYQIENRKIRSKWRKDWSDRNPERNYESQSNWRKENPEKNNGYAQERQIHKRHLISEREWRKCKEYFNNSCAFCGLPIEQHFKRYRGVLKNQDLHRDHADDKGSNGLNNCIPSCGSCNSSKHNSTIEEWYTFDNPMFSQERLDKINKWLTEDHKLYMEYKPPYTIIRKKNEGKKTFHFQLWSIDDEYKIVDLISEKERRKDLEEDVKKYLLSINA